jgi:hypothetical protein
MQTTRRGDGEIFLRGKTYAVRYYVNGRRRMVSARTSNLGKAQQFLRKLLKDKDDGQSTTLNGARLRISDGLARVVTDYKNNDRQSVANVERRIKKHLTPFFGTRRMATIAERDIEDYKAERRTAGATNAEINRELAIVRRAFRLAKLPHTVTMLKESAARSGFFEPDQFAAVRAHLSPALADVVTFAYITGWRKKRSARARMAAGRFRGARSAPRRRQDEEWRRPRVPVHGVVGRTAGITEGDQG